MTSFLCILVCCVAAFIAGAALYAGDIDTSWRLILFLVFRGPWAPTELICCMFNIDASLHVVTLVPIDISSYCISVWTRWISPRRNSKPKWIKIFKHLILIDHKMFAWILVFCTCRNHHYYILLKSMCTLI